MSILTRYLTREITKYFCIVLGVLLIVFLAIDFFEKIDKFLKADIPVTLAFWYFLFKIPFIVTQMLPIALLLAILITFGIMNRQNELIALKSSGIGIFHIVTSVTVLGLLFSILLFGLSEMLVPATMPGANRILLQEIKGQGALTTLENKWLQGDHSFYKIEQYNPSDRVMYNFTAYYMDDQFQLVRRVDAERGKFNDNNWIFQNLLVQEFNSDAHAPDVSFHSHQSMTADSIGLQAEDLLQIAPETDEMSCNALRAYIRRIEASGDNATRYRVDLQYKTAFPVVCLVMSLIATGVAVRGKLKGGLPVIISIGICIAFLYVVIIRFCQSLGYGDILHPVLAAWAGHFIFLCAGGFLIISAE
jgi:lipopolysaccharide export system permease protein